MTSLPLLQTSNDKEELKSIPTRSGALSILPVDVLYNVFTFYRTYETKPFPELTITHVCGFWRYAALDFAQLWNNLSITSKSPISLVALYLQRSRDTPLVLDCDLRPICNASEKEIRRTTVLWKLVLATASHWHKLTLRFNETNSAAVVLDLAQVRSPSLHTLRLRSSTTIGTSIPLLSGGAPNLEVLQLEYPRVDQFSPGSLQHLTHLEISSPILPISLTDLAKSLAPIRSLEHLSLEGKFMLVGEDNVSFPNLRYLRLAHLTTPMIIILHSVSAPALRELVMCDITYLDMLFPSLWLDELQQAYDNLDTLVLSGASTQVEATKFQRFFRIFPKLRHLALIEVDEFLIEEFAGVLRDRSLWPDLQTIVDLATPNAQCDLIASAHPSGCTWEFSILPDVSARLSRSEWVSRRGEASDSPSFGNAFVGAANSLIRMLQLYS